MKRFSTGIVLGLILGQLIGTVSFALAEQPIKLIVNGQQIATEVPPQLIDGRVLTPARALAEALGATVTWDGANNAVVVMSKGGTIQTSNPTLDKSDVKTDIQNTEQTKTEEVNSVKETTFRGIQAIEVNGMTYVHGYYYFDRSIHFNKETNSITINVNEKITEIPINKENVQMHKEQTYINIKYCN